MIDKPAVEKKFYTRLMDSYRRRAMYVPGVNTCIRTILATKATREYRKIARLGAAESDTIGRWYGKHRFFFGFAVPRSGTTFLANFLNSVVEREAQIEVATWMVQRVNVVTPRAVLEVVGSAGRVANGALTPVQRSDRCIGQRHRRKAVLELE